MNPLNDLDYTNGLRRRKIEIRFDLPSKETNRQILPVLKGFSAPNLTGMISFAENLK